MISGQKESFPTTSTQYSSKVRKGRAARMREVAAVREEEAARAITAEVAQRREQLAGMKAPLWELRAVTEWATTFLSVRPRCKFLILHADSRGVNNLRP